MWQSMCPTFFTTGDALPADRRKVIHSVGVVGRVEWRDIGGHPFTGMFKENFYIRSQHSKRKSNKTFSLYCIENTHYLYKI